TAVGGVSGGRANDEQELPGEGVEVPGLTVGVAVRLPAEPPRQQIDGPGDDERQQERAPQQKQDHGKDAQEDHVERQDVEELRLILQQQAFDDRTLRLVDEIVEPKTLAVGLVLHHQRRVADRRRKQNKCEDVSHIELPHPVIDVARRGDWPLPLERLSIDGRGGVAGYENEDLRRVGERDRVQRHIRQDVVRDVVDENEKERQTAKEIKAQIAPGALIRRGAVERGSCTLKHRHAASDAN